MSARVYQEGFKMAGFDDNGQYKETDVSIIRAEVPGPNGEWMFVVIGNKCCWIHGLPAGQGYEMYEIPLTGSQSTWQAQLDSIAQDGPKEDQPMVAVPMGTKTALAQADFFIVSE